jgi:hypothetical protein
MALHSTTPLPTPTLDPDLAELLPEFVALGVTITYVPPGRCSDHCEDCHADAVGYVCHRAPSEALPDGFAYRPPLCVEHLRAAVLWELRRGCPVWIEIPATHLDGAA